MFSPFAGKLSPDARRLGLMLRSDFWNYNGLQRAGAYLAGRGRTQLCRPEEIAGRRGYRFADEANIVIDGHLPKLALRLFAPGHLDLHWPYHLHVSVNGAALEPTAIEADNWSETTIPVPGGCSDSLIKIRITAYSPHFWNPASLSAPRGFVVGISDQL